MSAAAWRSYLYGRHGRGQSFRLFRGAPDPSSNPVINEYRRDNPNDAKLGVLWPEVLKAEDGETNLSAIRAEFYQPREMRLAITQGLLPEGAIQMAYLPDEVRVGPMDKVVPTDTSRRARQWLTLQRGAGDTDALGVEFPGGIVQVPGYTAVSYELSGTDITWLPGGPNPNLGQNYTVLLEFLPVYVCFGESVRPAPVVAGQRWLERVALVLFRPSESV